MCQAVEYLGHRVDADRLHTLDSKVAAIQQAPAPKNVQELRSLSFLGLVHYYGKFIPNLSILLQPLNNLLKSRLAKQLSRNGLMIAGRLSKRLL